MNVVVYRETRLKMGVETRLVCNWGVLVWFWSDFVFGKAMTTTLRRFKRSNSDLDEFPRHRVTKPTPCFWIAGRSLGDSRKFTGAVYLAIFGGVFTTSCEPTSYAGTVQKWFYRKYPFPEW